MHLWYNLEHLQGNAEFEVLNRLNSFFHAEIEEKGKLPTVLSLPSWRT
jgi:hypothetical protein